MRKSTKRTLVVTGVLATVAVGGASLDAQAGVRLASTKGAAAASAGTTSSPQATPTQSPGSGSDASLRVLTYNIKQGQIGREAGKGCAGAMSQIAKVIKSTDARVAALQEVDYGVDRSCDHVQTDELLARLGWSYACKGPATPHQGGRMGNAVISAHPITSCQNRALPVPADEEPRGAAVATITTPGGQSVTVASTHLTVGDEHAALRGRQATSLALMLGSTNGPAIAAGDFNATASEKGTMSPLKKAGFTDSLPALGENRGTCGTAQIDHLFARGATPTSGSIISSATASDHVPAFVDFQLPTSSKTMSSSPTATSPTGASTTGSGGRAMNAR
ncbi:hypothetical protein CGZ93_05105 [Enemella dayhoffiae]|uniref:Endonuclease/exonuclease/phosphatase domain-containing protein n=1 Tax=Enemella dayhoffiae TaxID=2016507 RepID=A0A255H8K7_9ACTN|nr:endonuclease/exonuclease/phosphatase family protein [Enemella dayhoffiae]OYO23899.1 hypothetical protein CGZ93_05105 [Enemella dayhoffiae]